MIAGALQHAAVGQLPGASAARFRAEYNASLRTAVDITAGREGGEERAD